MTEPRFCVTCVHFRFVEPFGRFPGPVSLECRHPLAPRDAVHGAWPTAAEQRRDVLHCGPSGRRYQQKPPTPPAEPRRRSLRDVFASWFQ